MIDDDSKSNIEHLLKEIEKKLECSALNGGFDRLMSKVDAIEESQTTIANKVDELHDSIYDPDNGLYARLKEIEHEKEMQVSELDRKFDELKVIGVFEEKSKVEKEAVDKTNRELLAKTATQLEDLIKWKDLVTSFAKWVIGSGAISASAKMLYNMLSGR